MTNSCSKLTLSKQTTKRARESRHHPKSNRKHKSAAKKFKSTFHEQLLASIHDDKLEDLADLTDNIERCGFGRELRAFWATQHRKIFHRLQYCRDTTIFDYLLSIGATDAWTWRTFDSWLRRIHFTSDDMKYKILRCVFSQKKKFFKLRVSSNTARHQYPRIRSALEMDVLRGAAAHGDRKFVENMLADAHWNCCIWQYVLLIAPMKSLDGCLMLMDMIPASLWDNINCSKHTDRISPIRRMGLSVFFSNVRFYQDVDEATHLWNAFSIRYLSKWKRELDIARTWPLMFNPFAFQVEPFASTVSSDPISIWKEIVCRFFQTDEDLLNSRIVLGSDVERLTAEFVGCGLMDFVLDGETDWTRFLMGRHVCVAQDDRSKLDWYGVREHGRVRDAVCHLCRHVVCM